MVTDSHFDRAADHPRRTEVLELLRAAPAPLGIADIAAAIGVHPNTARFHLDSLTEQGAVVRTMAEPVGRGRPRALYTAIPGMDRGGARRYQALARVLVNALATGPDPRRKALDVGRAWGTRMAAGVASRPAGVDADADADAGADVDAAVATLTGLLAEFDFAPRHVPDPPALSGSEQSEGSEVGTPGHLRLEHCPFLELAEEFGPVVCPLHLGMMQGVLAEMDTPLRAEAIEPFAEPDACVVRLGVGRG